MSVSCHADVCSQLKDMHTSEMELEKKRRMGMLCHTVEV